MERLRNLMAAILMLAGLVASTDVRGASVNDGDDVYIIVEQMPVYPGGDEALRNFVTNNVQYPEAAYKDGIQGRVFVTFVVDTNGEVTGVKVARSVNVLLDAEAVRIVKSMPKWTPGMHRGKAVKVSYTIPINFSLK